MQIVSELKLQQWCLAHMASEIVVSRTWYLGLVRRVRCGYMLNMVNLVLFFFFRSAATSMTSSNTSQILMIEKFVLELMQYESPVKCNCR